MTKDELRAELERQKQTDEAFQEEVSKEERRQATLHQD